MYNLLNKPQTIHRLNIVKVTSDKEWNIDVCDNCLDKFIASLDLIFGYSEVLNLHYGTCEICRQDTKYKTICKNSKRRNFNRRA